MTCAATSRVPATALSYPRTHVICGHLGRQATHDDVAVHQANIADIKAGVKEALTSIDPLAFAMTCRENARIGVRVHLDTVTDRVASPVIAKYTGFVAAADIEVFTRTTFVERRRSAASHTATRAAWARRG